MDPQQAHASHPEIPEQDPTHDIDGKKTWTWLLSCTVGIFAIVFVLDQVFHAVTFRQRVLRIEQAPTTELDALRAQERENLSAGEGRRDLETAIADYIEKHEK